MLWEVYAALNRNDISPMVKAFDRDIEWIEPAAFPGRGGHPAVQSHLSQVRESWAEGLCAGPLETRGAMA